MSGESRGGLGPADDAKADGQKKPAKGKKMPKGGKGKGKKQRSKL